MKRYAILALLILAALAFIIVPLVRNSGSDTDALEMASLKQEGNLLAKSGEKLPLEITVPAEGVKAVELFYNDSVFAKWNAPKGNIRFLLDAGYFGVGARYLVLRTFFADGTTEENSRIVRVLSDISPKALTAEVISGTPHDVTSYTQGLEFDNGQLYEASGDPNHTGASKIGKVNLSNGQFTLKNGLDANYFGEGITIMGDQLFQLTWREGKCFVWNKNTMELIKDFTYTGEGWGLCNDGKYLIMSDGTERITFRDPATFRVVRTMEVYDDNGPRVALNELEYIDGKIYANVYTTNTVIAIDPNTGKVLETIDASALVPEGRMNGEVLNGIAYNHLTKELYMTGKYWGKILKVRLKE